MKVQDKNLERAYAALTKASENQELSLHGALANIVDLLDDLEDILLSLGYSEGDVEELPDKYNDWDE